MKIVSRPRQGGKTTEILDELTANPEAILIVIDARERGRIINLLVWRGNHTSPDAKDEARRYWSRRVTTPREGLLTNRRGVPRAHVLIDNLDLVLAALYGDVDTVTITSVESI